MFTDDVQGWKELGQLHLSRSACQRQAASPTGLGHHHSTPTSVPSMVLPSPRCWGLYCNRCTLTRSSPELSSGPWPCHVVPSLSSSPWFQKYWACHGYGVCTFTSGHSCCQTSAILHDRVMHSKPVSPGRHTTKFSSQHGFQPWSSSNHSFCVLTVRKSSQRTPLQWCWCLLNHSWLNSTYPESFVPGKVSLQWYWCLLKHN